MLVEIFLLTHNSGLLNLERFSILELDFSALLQHHMDDSIKILIDLSHDLDFALFNFLPQLGALSDEELCSSAQRIQV